MSKASDSAKRAQEHLQALIPRLSEAERNSSDWMGIGFPGGGSGGGRGKGDHSDPTFAAADGALKRTAIGAARDFAAKDRAIIDEGLVTAELALRRVRDAVARCVSVPVGTLTAAEGCEPCSRVQGGSGPHEASWQAVYTRIPRPENPEGPKLALCSFHYEFHQRYDILPCPSIDKYHLDHLGSRIPYNMIRDYHPDQWSMAQSRLRGKMLGRQNLNLGATG